MVHTKQTLTNQLKQQLERESHRQPTLQTELKREWERAYKELLMVPSIFSQSWILLGARVWVLLGARVWVENTTGEEIANDVERAPPDNMSDAQREIRTLLGIRGLKQTQINMCQVALEEWQSIGQYYTKPVNETQAEVRSVRNELYQLLLSFSAFQGLLITAVAQSSLLQCPQCWFPVSALCVSHGGRCNWNGPKEHAHWILEENETRGRSCTKGRVSLYILSCQHENWSLRKIITNCEAFECVFFFSVCTKSSLSCALLTLELQQMLFSGISQ